MPVLVATDSFIAVDALPSPDSSKDIQHFIDIGRQIENRYGIANHFLSRISKNAFSTAVPTCNCAVHALAENRVIRRFPNRTEQLPRADEVSILGQIGRL